MRVLVTGVTGFLGSHVAEVLLEAGHEVVALVRDPSALDEDLRRWLEAPSTPRVSRRLRLVQGSLADQGALREAASGAEAAVHVAGLIQARSEGAYMKVNRDGTESVLRAVESTAGAPRGFVLISSQAAGGPGGTPESGAGDEPSRPISAYGRSKRAGEERALARTGVFPVTILRPPVIFGPRDRMLGRVFRAVRRGRAAVWGDGSNAFQVVYARDAARAALMALESSPPSGSIFYPADDRVFTWRSFLRSLAEALGVRVRIFEVPAPAFTGVAAVTTLLSFFTGRPPLLPFDKILELREPAWLCSSRAARDLLGWSPSSSVEEALAATCAWYRTRGLL